MSEQRSIPLFPLNTVLFPGGFLPLRIFEPRYLDMISECLRADKMFGVCLIKKGVEVGHAADSHEIGTFAVIIDWHRRDDGLLGVLAQGGGRFRVEARRVRANQLVEADVETLPPSPVVPLPAHLRGLTEVLKIFLEHIGEPYSTQVFEEDNAAWVGCRLAELLPMDLPRRQYLLELEDPLERLQNVADILKELKVNY